MEDNLKNILINFKKTWRFVKEDKKYIILFLIFSLILCGISVITPLLSAKMLLYLTDGLFKELITVTIIVLIVEIKRNVFNYLYNYLLSQKSVKKRVTEVNNSYFECKTINFDINQIREEYEILEKKIQDTDFEISKLNSIEFEIDI